MPSQSQISSFQTKLNRRSQTWQKRDRRHSYHRNRLHDLQALVLPKASRAQSEPPE